MRLFGFDLRLTRAAPSGPLAPARGSGGWLPVIREPYAGAWQQNNEITAETALRNPAVYTCVSLIASDIAKLTLRLVAEGPAGIWTPTTSAAFSPVLARPNRYQIPFQFVQQWQTSKLLAGNTYALKQRDGRGVVTDLYLLDPARVTVLVAPDGAVYYELATDDLAGIPPPPPEGRGVIVPAREIIHDRMITLFHPLVGVSPLFAAAVTALQGSAIQDNSRRFFSQGSFPSGLILVPGDITELNAKEIKDYWQTEFSGANVGNVAVLSQGAKFEPMTITAVDAQLIDQLKWSAETICSVYHVPAYMAGIGPPPPYANVEPLVQQYYAQCLQSLITAQETSLDAGLELPAPYGTEFDIDDLVWLNLEARGKAAHDAINAGALSPNEARKKYFGLGPVKGGDTPYLQQQYYPIDALADRELAAAPAASAPMPAPVQGQAAAPVAPVEALELGALLQALEAAAIAEGLYAHA